MEKHKYKDLIKFVHLDGIKEFKQTNPSLFSEDGISTSTFEVDNGKCAIVSWDDVKHAIDLYLNKQISYNQLQQWGEWMYMSDCFQIAEKNNDDDEELIDIISDIDSLDLVENEKDKEMCIKNLTNKLEKHYLKNM